MAFFKRHFVAILCLLCFVGCVTDELAVYKDSVVSKEAVKAFVGVYQVEEWPGDAKPESVCVTDKDGELSFAYSVPDKKVDLRFMLSTIPNSKKDLYLLSIPSQDGTNNANMFFVGQAEKEQTHIWVVHSDFPVAKGQLSFSCGKAKADDVKQFLAKHADAFVTANEPQVTFMNPKD